MPFGYWGKILCVNLCSGKIEVEEPLDEIYRQYLGGYGLGIHYLYSHIPVGSNPLGKENILAFLPGLLTGSGAEFSGRFMVATRSPLTGAWADTNCGGNFGPALRGAGWDGLFISGQAAHPVYIYMDEKTIEIRDASHLWGLDTRQTETALQKAAGSDVKIACIGPAGEKRSLISGIVNDDGRLAARCGVGAVMGSKNLKAVVVRGRARPPLADQVTFKAASAKYLTLFRQKPNRLSGNVNKILSFLLPIIRRMGGHLSSGPTELVVDSYKRYGTSAGTSILVELGDTPIRNWIGIGYRDFPLKLSEGLSDQAVVRTLVRPYACHSCPVACGGIVNQPDGGVNHKPEYETLASFGPLVMNSDLATVMSCNQICNLAGLDSISTGGVIAFALECAEKDWLPPELSGEMELKWGDSAAIIELTRRIASRTKGLGDWLADGVQKASQRLHPAAQLAAIHSGGQELAMHRGLYEPGVAVGYAFDPAPGRHTSTNSGNAEVSPFVPYFNLIGCQPAKRYNFNEEGVTQAISMSLYRAFDSLGLCQFALLMGQPPFLEWLNSSTGWSVDKNEFFQIGKRIHVLRHAFNSKHGLPAQFRLPGRETGDPPQVAGPVAKRALDMKAMAKSYFEFLGIDPLTGIPLSATTKELDLEL